MVRRVVVGIAMALCVVVSTTSVSIAQNESTVRDLANGSDYRVRVAAALALGRSRDPSARPALERALGDSHPAVRAAAAAALGMLGDPAAVPALQAAAGHESADSVRNQMQSSIAKLSGGAGASSAQTKFLVTLGRMENRSGASAQVASQFKSVTRSKMAQVPGVEVVPDGADAASAGRNRRLPVFAVDGSLTQLAKAQDGNDLAVSAKVTYVIRKLPEQSLKGSITGAAQAAVDARAVKGQGDLAQLQIDAVSAAIDRAIKGAPPAFEAAAIK